MIHDDIVLSAAHCESRETPFHLRVFVNGLETEQGVYRTIERMETHPLYNKEKNNDYDFMLLKLHKSALKDDDGKDTGVTTVALNRDSKLPIVGQDLMAAGYGTTSEGASETSAVLMDVKVQYVDDKECAKQYGKDTYVPALQFCAGVPGGGKDTCQGDSGGPIIIEGKGGAPTVQAGVVSFGIGCAKAEFNGVYARISSVTEWIDRMVCELSDVPPDGCPAKEVRTILQGPGKIDLKITYDGYAKETALMLIQDSSGKQLYYQPFRSPNAKNKATETHSFTSLGPGTYTLVVGDEGKDGFW
jgi:secreted trypsin-like serine protease